MIEAIDNVLTRVDPDDLSELDMADLRVLRTEASALEDDVSLVRRVAQGRLDSIGHEVQRRSGGSADPAPDLSAVLFDLPDILVDQRAPSGEGSLPTRAVTVGEPGPAAAELFTQLDANATSSDLASVESCSDEDLAAMLARVRGFEEKLSEVRRSLHERIDMVQGEIARRYRDGEASVDALLS